MPNVQVILQGARIATYDINDFPIVLQYGDKRSYDTAVWYIPAFSLRIPSHRLSEIRTQHGSFEVIIDGPDGFKQGPFQTTWVRNYYPRGKDCALVLVVPDSQKLNGVSLCTVEDSLVIEPLGG